MRNKNGQTALILILLTAAALIFLAVTLNWGRISQTKTQLTIAADQGASLLASDAASYGEMEKQQYLGNSNQVSSTTGVLEAFIVLVLSIIITICTLGATWYLVVIAVANLALQVLVIQPMITALWNKLQTDQPITQQFYEGGIAAALENSIGDQVSITDYFDSNANGIMGNNASGFPKDTVSRFALFYTDRLKMLNQGPIPQVVFFHDQLEELMNGETCSQSENDYKNYPALFGYDYKNYPGLFGLINTYCNSDKVSTVSSTYCITNSTDPACLEKIPGDFQLNDQCPVNTFNSSGSNTAYNPYCDPCCQPATVNGKPARPSNCPTDVTTECGTNNPYSSLGSFPYLYDPTYQNYANGLSFLDQFGRDQQAPLSGEPPFAGLTTQGNFPNGVYPFFWMMKDYSPEVDNINSSNLQSAQYHWCTSNVTSPYTAPTGYPDLAQLNLTNSSGYSCQGPDCCVNYLADKVGVVGGVATPVSDGTLNGTTNGKIDIVTGAPIVSFNTVSNSYVTDPSFGEGGSGTWTEGDNQMCLAQWPYNGATAGAEDGTCEWTNTATAPSSFTPVANVSTVDGLDDVMHTLSDFVNFSNKLLSNDVGTLSSTFDSWYPQAAEWIAPTCPSSGRTKCTPGFKGSPPVCTTNYSCNSACDDGSPCSSTGQCADGSTCSSMSGRLLSIYNPNTGFDLLNQWAGINGTDGATADGAITTWLNNNYTPSSSPYPWCAPPENDPSLNVKGVPTVENNYISTLGNTVPASSWVGDIPHVIACENYNANVSVTNYQQCFAALPPGPTCPGSLPAKCAALTLGRSLAGTAPVYDGCTGNYAKWVNNSLTLATDEAPKFALRAQFLSDLYTRAQNMQKIFNQADAALQAFFKPCASVSCTDGSTCSTSNKCADGTACGACAAGGPASQLIWARSQPSPTETLPNSVIYGWQDAAPVSGSGGCTDTNGNRVGCSHIVKVTAYSPGREGGFALSVLPWIYTSSSFFTRSYTLVDRDGHVYVSVKRWDEDHGTSSSFPNGHPLWQMLFHSPNAQSTTGTWPPTGCQGMPVTMPDGTTKSIGFGLTPQTVAGLEFAGITPQDQKSLANVFMLNDEGNGNVDPSAGSQSSYSSCLAAVNSLLTSAPESHACAQYVASSPGSNPGSVQSGSSQNGDADYSLKFYSCPEQPDDLALGEGQ